MGKAEVLIVADEDIVAMDLAFKLLMDIGLSREMDGIDSAAQIRDQFDILVVYITAYVDEPTLA